MESQGMDTHNQESNDDYNSSQLFGKAFGTRDNLIHDAKTFYFQKGYALVIKKSQNDRFVSIGCDRGGVYRDPRNIPVELRVRKTSSRLINCPFELVGKKKSNGDWELQLVNEFHNHDASIDMSGHPSCRRLSKQEILSVEEMTSSGIPPRQVLSSLRQKNPSLQAISTTVYNAIRKIKEDKLGGRTMIEALFQELGQGNFFYNIKHDENGRLTHLFFAHPASIVLTRSFWHVFVMDCTYKTNKYKMPLLDIIGVSCFNTSFYSCFAFMEKERKEDYVWALTMFREVLGPSCQPVVIISDRELALMNAIKTIFPKATNLLCVWHIEKNLLANAKRHFETNEVWDAFMSLWNIVIRSPSELDLQKNWKLFEELYKDKREVLAYIQKTWFPYKEHFINAWTEKFLHFGHRVSSRAEGAHAKLKQYLHVSTGDFRQVKDKICLAIDNEFHHIKTQLSSEKLRVHHSCNIVFFKEVVRKVSMYALRELHKQYEMAKYGTLKPSCTGHFITTMGLPCAHEMVTTWKDGVLPISSIHSHWRLDSLSLVGRDASKNEKEYFEQLVSKLHGKFENWPLAHKEIACGTISQLVGAQFRPLCEPIAPTPNAYAVGSKRKRASSSTNRDPSRFEVVERRRKCSGCKSTEHDIRTCPSKNKDSEQISFAVDLLDESGMGTIDLNEMSGLDSLV